LKAQVIKKDEKIVFYRFLLKEFRPTGADIRSLGFLNNKRQ